MGRPCHRRSEELNGEVPDLKKGRSLEATPSDPGVVRTGRWGPHVGSGTLPEPTSFGKRLENRSEWILYRRHRVLTSPTKGRGEPFTAQNSLTLYDQRTG